jgi:hypothetical protein
VPKHDSKAFRKNDAKRCKKTSRLIDYSCSLQSNQSAPNHLRKKKKNNPAKKEEPHVPAHCPIRTSDLCITSATPYHLAKQAFDWSDFRFIQYIRLLALLTRRGYLANSVLMIVIPYGNRLEVGLFIPGLRCSSQRVILDMLCNV